jgi:ferredoxin
VSEAMRIRLDRTMCDGFGVCAKHAPEYFSLDDWGYASLIGDGTVPESDRPAVLRALLDCPVHAIIEVGGRPPLRERPHPVPDEAPEPNPSNADNEAISGFVR